MPLSKVKSSKQARRLNDRISGWERVSTSEKYGKSGKPTFRKPGSNKK